MKNRFRAIRHSDSCMIIIKGQSPDIIGIDDMNKQLAGSIRTMLLSDIATVLDVSLVSLIEEGSIDVDINSSNGKYKIDIFDPECLTRLRDEETLNWSCGKSK